VKVYVLQYRHRHGVDISVFANPEAVTRAKAAICNQFVDDKIFTAIGGADQGSPVHETVRALYAEGKYDKCIEEYLFANQDEEFEVSEHEVQS
jgi:hypothetical protein